MTAPQVSRETTDTIAAIATAPGRGGVGVVRVSGPASPEICRAIAGDVVRDRRASFRRLVDARGAVMDEALVLLFRAPNSYTGEDVLELQCHGGQALLASVLRRCVELGCRLARPGEFTQRAFLNNKLDLAQAEAVADLIEASSEAAVRSAVRTLTGEFSAKINALILSLTGLRAHVEACIDFPEEEIDVADRNAQMKHLHGLRKELNDVMQTAAMGVVLRDGLTVVLVGQPNVGKSSLLNRLSGDEVAIVTPVAGTTRDMVRATVHVHGIPIHLIDTAGLRETEDVVERAGIERAWRAIANADAALFITEAGAARPDEDLALLDKMPRGLPVALVYNKVDLRRARPVSRETIADGITERLHVSALTGEGIDELRGWLVNLSGRKPHTEGVFLARERHLQALAEADGYFAGASRHEAQLELFAENLRLAQNALGKITGVVTADDLLGEIFGSFCIGK